MQHIQTQAKPLLRVLRAFRVFLVLAVMLLTGVYSYTRGSGDSHVYAATSSNLNFQARLLNSSGSIVPDGYYNITFNLYSVSTGGSSLWSEQYYDSNGVTAGNDNRVRVVNGYLSVNLASQTAFPAINWDQDLWLTMNVGGATQTATPTYDGEMTPRIKLTAVPYAFQSKQAETLVQLQGANTGTLDFTTLTGNRSIVLPDASGTVTLQASGLSAGSITFANSSGILTQDNANLFFDDTNNTVGIGTTRTGAIDGIGNSRLVVQGSGATSATSALNVRDSSGTGSLFLVRDDGNIGIGDASPAYLLTVGSGDKFGIDSLGRINFEGSTSDVVQTILGVTDPTVGDQIYLLPNAAAAGTYTICTSANNCVGLGNFINNSTSIQANSNFAIQSAAAGSIGGVIRGATSQTADLLQFQNATPTVIAGVNSNGRLYYANSGFTGLIDMSTLTANQTYTLPGDRSGTFCLTSGNCAGVGGTGDILDNGQNGPITIGTNDNTTFTLETNNTPRITILNSGNVGINTVTPTGLLQVAQPTVGPGTVATAGTTTLTGTSTQFLSTFKVGDTITVSGETVRTITAISNDTSLTVNTAFATSASGLSYTLTGGSRLTVLGNGNVGIGTNNPLEKLHISSTGTSTTLGQLDTNLRLQTNTVTGNAGNEISFMGITGGAASEGALTYAAISAPVSGNNATTGTVGYLSFSTKALATDTSLTERLRITASGNIGIGNNGTTGLLSVGSSAQFQVSSAGALTAVGVNSGTGLIQGTGGLTVTGAVVNLNVSSNFATNINTGSSTGAVSIGNNAAGAITLQSGSAISIGNNAIAQAITIGNGTGTTAVSILCGSGTCGIGNNATDHATTLGSTTGASATTIQGGTTGISLNAATINSSAATVALFGSPTSITLGAAATTFNIGPAGASAATINLAGGSGATGCTVDGATGNLTCSGDMVTNSRLGVGTATTTNGQINLAASTSITDGIAFGTDAGIYRSNTAELRVVGSLVVGTNLQVNANFTSQGDVAVNGGDLTTTATTFNLLNATATTINFGGATTTLNIGPTGSSASNILLSGGSADTGCTINGANGNLTCSGTISGSTSYLAKNAPDASSFAVTAANYLYGFTNSSSAIASGVLNLDNGTNTGSTLRITTAGNPGAGNALIFASNTNVSPTGNLLDLQSGSSPTSKFSVSATGVTTVAGILNANATGKTAITIADSGAQLSGITIGGDTNLYRGAANTLSTDDIFNLATATSATGGYIAQSGTRLIHTYTGTGSFYAGSSAGNFTMTGTNNTGIGASTLQANTTGNGNTAVGNSALFNNQGGGGNSAVGLQALFNNTSGAGNVAVGQSSLLGNAGGSLNVGIGYRAGYTSVSGNANVSGTGNTFIGNDAGPGSATQLQNATAIGTYAVVAQSNSMVLGCISGTNGCTTSTQVGIGTTAPSATLHVVGTTTAAGGAINLNASSNFATNINTGSSTGAVAIGNSSTSDFVLEAGTGTTALFNGATAHTIQLATGAAAQNVTIGSTASTSILNLQAGSGNINLASTGTIQLQTNTDITGTLSVSSNLTVTGSGNGSSDYGALFRNAANSTTAFAVQNAAGDNVLSVNTTNRRVGINVTTPARELHVDGNVRIDRGANSAGMFLHRYDGANPWKTFFFGVDATGTNTGEFFISDFGSAVSGSSTRRLTIDTDGSVIVSSVQTSVAQNFYVDGSSLLKSISNSTSAFEVQTSGAAAVLSVDTANSRVGIGTDAPLRALDVNSSIIRILQTTTAPTLTNNGDFAIGHVGTGATNGRIWVRSDGVTYRFQSVANTADYSEFYSQSAPSQIGDIMSIDGDSAVDGTGKAHKSAIPYDPGLLGAVTDRGTSYNDPDDNRWNDPNFANVGLLGQVFVKVSTENGPIAAGDPITSSSQPGVGMKATRPGVILGKALKSYSGAGVEKILVQVNPGWNDPTVPGAIQGDTGVFNTLDVGGLGSFGSLNVSGHTTLNTLTVTTATVSGDLTVQGLAAVGSLKIFGSAEVLGDVNFAGVGQSRNAVTKKFTASKDLYVGDVVVADPANDGQVTTTATAADTRVLGIVLTDTLAGQDATVAIGGSVQVKAASNTILNGDLLVSSATEGKANKYSAPTVGSVLGKALGKPDANGMVWILVTLN